MKKAKFLALCLAVAMLCSGCGVIKAVGSVVQALNTPVEEQDHRERMSQWVEVDVTGGEQTYFYDDHGGFLGDGMTFAVLRFPDEALLPAIEANLGWRELPLSENLAVALHGSAGKGHVLIADDRGNPYFPYVENGYWYFFDRRNDDLAPGGHYDDSRLFDRHSYNFYAAVYDTDTNTMYITAFDT